MLRQANWLYARKEKTHTEPRECPIIISKASLQAAFGAILRDAPAPNCFLDLLAVRVAI